MLVNKIKRTTRADFVPESKHIENIGLVNLVSTCAISHAGEKQKSKIQKCPVSLSPAGVLSPALKRNQTHTSSEVHRHRKRFFV